MVWAMVGLIVGARLGYALFYNFSYFMAHPLEIILPFDFSDGIRFVGLSGMSYHGGFIGVAAVTIYVCHKHKIKLWQFGDWLCAAIPLGYMFGRLGNFINGELWGRVTTVPWGMYFPLDPTRSLRHPSQLYEALFEGLFLFCVLWPIRKKILSTVSPLVFMFSVTVWFVSSSSFSANRMHTLDLFWDSIRWVRFFAY